MYTPSIQNLIFDFGGVILNLHTEKTYRAFADLAGIPLEAMKAKVRDSSFFDSYEKGLLSDDQFREAVQKMINARLTTQQIDDAWNAMLGTIPLQRLELLERLRTRHRVFLLSNTNAIHLRHFNGIIRDVSGKPALDHFFERAYYSHLLKMRKPDQEIFDHVLRENELNATQTLFLDDNLDNLKGAEQAGIRTVHVAHPDVIFSVFNDA